MERYAFIREIASTRSLLAIGIACFRRMADGTDAKQVKYEARVFDLSLLSQVRGPLFLTSTFISQSISSFSVLEQSAKCVFFLVRFPFFHILCACAFFDIRYLTW